MMNVEVRIQVASSHDDSLSYVGPSPPPPPPASPLLEPPSLPRIPEDESFDMFTVSVVVTVKLSVTDKVMLANQTSKNGINKIWTPRYFPQRKKGKNDRF